MTRLIKRKQLFILGHKNRSSRWDGDGGVTFSSQMNKCIVTKRHFSNCPIQKSIPNGIAIHVPISVPNSIPNAINGFPNGVPIGILNVVPIGVPNGFPHSIQNGVSYSIQNGVRDLAFYFRELGHTLKAQKLLFIDKEQRLTVLWHRCNH